eukprot:403336692
MQPETSQNISIKSNNQKNPKIKLIPSRKKGEDLFQFSHAYFLEKGIKNQRYEILDDRESISQEFKDLVIEPYFRDIYSDLVIRSTDPSKGIDKLTIMKYSQLPGIIAERFFALLDINKNGFISFQDFMNKLLMLFHSSLQEKLHSIFQMYDFDNDGEVHKEDVKIILSHMPLVKEDESIEQNQCSSPITQNFRVLKMKGEKTKEDIKEFLDNIFKIKSSINFSQFCQINARYSSDMFLSNSNFDQYEEQSPSPINQLTNLVIKNKRFYKQIKQYSFNIEKQSFNSNIEVGFQQNNTPQHKNQRWLTPINHDKFFEKAPGEEQSIYQQSQQNFNSSKSTSLSSKAKSISKKKCTLPIDSLLCEDEDENCVEIIKEEVLIRRSGDTFKPIWISIFGKEIYFHVRNDDRGHETMVSVVGVFVKEQTPEQLPNGDILFPIKLSFPGHKQRTIYLKDAESRIYWMSIFDKVLKTKSIHKFYSIEQKLGEGKYGQVRKAINKITNEEVAVKILKKNVDDQEDLQLQLSEMEILKVCSHPNIAQLIDIFESKNHSYIVMELLKGDNLSNYLKARQHELKEARVATLIYQIASAIKYLHDLGIMHRDLKPANILMTDESDQAQAKLADFGFSTIVGPSQLLTDGFGSLLFTAPEIIGGCPYGKEIDLWSLGVILHVLLTKEYPFYDQTQDALKRKIMFEKFTFQSKKWDSISAEAKLLCEGLLTKNKQKRLTVDQVLESEWFKINSATTRDSLNNKIQIEKIQSKKCIAQPSSPLSQIFNSPKNIKTTLPTLKLSKFALQRQENKNNQQLSSGAIINSINKSQFNNNNKNNINNTIQSKIIATDGSNQIRIHKRSLILKTPSPNYNKNKLRIQMSNFRDDEIEEYKIE